MPAPYPVIVNGPVDDDVEALLVGGLAEGLVGAGAGLHNELEFYLLLFVDQIDCNCLVGGSFRQQTVHGDTCGAG